MPAKFGVYRIEGERHGWLVDGSLGKRWCVCETGRFFIRSKLQFCRAELYTILAQSGKVSECVMSRTG